MRTATTLLCCPLQCPGQVLGYNSDAAAAEAAAAELRAARDVQVETVGGDLTLPATADALFDAVASRFGGRCTAVVHNAGGLRPRACGVNALLLAPSVKTQSTHSVPLPFLLPAKGQVCTLE